MTIGQRIKQRRIELGLSQEQLAHRLGNKSRASVCTVENDKEDLTSDRIRKYAEALETTPAYIMGWEDNSEDDIQSKLIDVYTFNNLMNNLSPEEREKVQDLFLQILKLTPENRTSLLTLLKSLLPDA